ncbi:unnamed protein product, partial [Prorocentrum cordatum]
KFWTECKQWKIKKVAFRSVVLGAAAAGLAGLVLSEAQTDTLDRQRLKSDAYYLMEWLCDYRSMAEAAEHIWLRLGVVPIAVELRVQWPKEWQAISSRPHWHKQQLAAVFGDLKLEMAKESGLSLIGEDCMGLFDAESDANAAFNLLGVRQSCSEWLTRL